ncbi:TraB/GumN family protein [Flavobacterium chuncheonense]|uniref:TraB/GumN family protein n=1 Tax=Flavobacterium chuncheonense TaxID=2026653 RepID=A0ABW5YPT3_9FLAO
MKIKHRTTFLLFVLTSTLLFGQNSAVFDNNKTLLFKVTKENSNKETYLFGTHHALGKSFFDSLPIANEALESSEIAIFESLNIPGQMFPDIVSKRTTTTDWEKYFNKEDYTFIKALLQNSNTDYTKMTPTEMYTFLNRHHKQYICKKRAEGDTSFTLDDYIVSRAKDFNLKVIGLETTANQIKWINQDVEGMPRRTHKKRLSYAVNRIRTKDTSSCQEINWFTNLNIDLQLDKPCLNSLMLTDRNARWMETIKSLIETNNCFIAVGFSHYWYECGLINQLMNLGYKIEPVQLK